MIGAYLIECTYKVQIQLGAIIHERGRSSGMANQGQFG